MNYGFRLLAILLVLMGSNLAWAKRVPLLPNEVYLTLNAPDIDRNNHQVLPDEGLPRNWRSSESQFIKERFQGTGSPSLQGLDTLNISGSGEFSKGQFNQVLNKLNGKKIVIIDLRQEPHGLVNAFAVSWYGNDNAINQNRSVESIEKDEEERLNALKKNKTTILTKWIDKKGALKKSKEFSTVKISIPVTSVMSEKSLVVQAGAAYFRIPSPDYKRPRDEDVDRFISFYKNVKADQWLHFHCAAGEGRTTTYMTLYDMMKNSSRVSEDDIIKRQKLLGGSDLLKINKEDPTRKVWSTERAEFIHKFYTYCKSQGPDFKKTWSEWIKLVK